jgi:hypothetical protein
MGSQVIKKANNRCTLMESKECRKEQEGEKKGGGKGEVAKGEVG